MIEIIVKNGGHEAFYAVAKPKKNSEGTLSVQLKGFGGGLKTLGDVEMNEDEGVAGVVKSIFQLIEDRQTMN